MSDDASDSAVSNDDFMCPKCQSYLSITSSPPSTEPKQGPADNPNSNDKSAKTTTPICSVCLGLWDPTLSTQWLQGALQRACEPYGGIAANRFCTLANHGPTLSICGDVYLRYRNKQQQQQQQRQTTSSSSSSSTLYSIYLHDLKQALYQRIQEIIKNDAAESSSSSSSSKPPILSNSEQQGYLSIHISCIPPKGQSILDQAVAHSSHYNSNNKKRKRSRHKGPFTTQGGDPRVSLERRLQAQGYQWWTLAEAEEQSSSILAPANNHLLGMIITSPLMMECHVAVFRRPIFLYGYYTKSRRDVSQTPFVVMDKKEDGRGEGATTNKANANGAAIDNNDNDNTNKNSTTTVMTTLGVTSVEEEICNPIIQLLGVSTENNLPASSSSESSSSAAAGSVQYGMCKFHASGREDMDVRMLLRPSIMSATNRGRPFCVQIVDSLRPLQSAHQLKEIVRRINHENDSDQDQDQDGPGGGGAAAAASSSPLWYGSNPMGVGVASLQLVSASAFSGLQADTESKVKHYGCHCWSEQELPDDWTFDLAHHHPQLQSSQPLPLPLPLPLTIQQRTPLRVLHRRANLVRERQILAAQARRVDAHHFRLELTTQAGTYVKEFVHGDLRRTTPSMATLLGTKTNILLLDCEGIEIDEESISQKSESES